MCYRGGRGCECGGPAGPGGVRVGWGTEGKGCGSESGAQLDGLPRASPQRITYNTKTRTADARATLMHARAPPMRPQGLHNNSTATAQPSLTSTTLLPTTTTATTSIHALRFPVSISGYPHHTTDLHNSPPTNPASHPTTTTTPFPVPIPASPGFHDSDRHIN
jgi:hypothetical protein